LAAIIAAKMAVMPGGRPPATFDSVEQSRFDRAAVVVVSEPEFGLLLAAHGERLDGAVNAGALQLAAALRARRVARKIQCGFIKGRPSIREALDALIESEILVYPLFLADGYFSRVRLRQLLAEGPQLARMRVMLPLGLDPSLVRLVGDRAAGAARSHDLEPRDVAVVLFAHGSTKDSASREACDWQADQLARSGQFGDVRIALLEEPPYLPAVLAEISGPTIVVGMFVGEGLHGRGDTPRIIAEINRRDVIFAGNVGACSDLADIVAASVAREAHQPAASPR